MKSRLIELNKGEMCVCGQLDERMGRGEVSGKPCKRPSVEMMVNLSTGES